MPAPDSARSALTSCAIYGVALAVVAAVYWPLSHADFVWVDKICFRDNAWLRHGDDWKQFVFRNFYEWVNYFRPLVVALFTLEVRIFDAAPGPMHLVSLALHMANTCLVGAFAAAAFPDAKRPVEHPWAVLAAMLLFGLHPALVETTSWISSQFETVATFWMLFGLVLHLRIERAVSRAPVVAGCFFLAACSKESAVALPLLLLLFDWTRTSPGVSPRMRFQQIARSQSSVYTCVMIAGIAYLLFRHWALGFLVNAAAHESLGFFQRLQEVCFVYLTYWRIVVWPMIGLGPIHEIDAVRFAAPSASSLIVDSAAFAIAILGLCLAWHRKPLGILIVAVSIALLPVLHILPVGFDASLYHERYATMAIALACAIVPHLIAVTGPAPDGHKRYRFATAAVAVAWLALAVANIRVTVPLWSNEVALWQWVLQDHPESITAQDHLLATYLEQENYPAARPLADRLVANNAPCPTCMLNAANLALVEGDMARAREALEKAKALRGSAQPRILQGLTLATGQLLALEHDIAGAEAAFREAVALDPQEPQARMSLALLLAVEGRREEARAESRIALDLFAPEQRARRRLTFEQVMKSYSTDRE